MWFEKFSQPILSQGWTHFEVDPIAFRTSLSIRYIIVYVYVDDILFIGSYVARISWVKAYRFDKLIECVFDNMLCMHEIT